MSAGTAPRVENAGGPGLVLLLGSTPELAELAGDLHGQGWAIRAVKSMAGAPLPGPAPDAVVMGGNVAPDEIEEAVSRAMAGSARSPVVLVYIAAADPIVGARYLKEGADDVLFAPVSAETLYLRIETLRLCGARGWSAHRTWRLGSVRFDPVLRRVSRNGSSVELTDREFRLFYALADRLGEPRSSRELVDGIWDGDGSGALRTTASRLRRKLEEVGADLRLEGLNGGGYVLLVPGRESA